MSLSEDILALALVVDKNIDGRYRTGYQIATEHAAELAAAAGWQPIETMPYDEIVLVKNEQGNIGQDFYYDCTLEWWLDHHPKDNKIVNWMHIPK